MEASEIVQTYVAFPGSVLPRAIKSLKAFARVTLAPGETRRVRMTIATDDLRYRDPATHGWRMEPGRHAILVGGSSAGPFLSADIAL